MKVPLAIRQLSRKLTGRPEEFSLENRIFHGVSIVTVILLISAVLVNISIGLYNALPLLFLIIVMHAAIFYLSRYKRKFRWAVYGLAIVGFGGTAATFFNKSGIDGPAVFISFFITQLLIAVVAKRYHVFILLFSFIMTGVLFYIELHHPELITFIYKNPQSRLADYYLTFLMISAFFYLITRVLSDNYNAEKSRAEKQTESLEQKHLDLQKAVIEKERMFSLVFHDLRNPLSAIQFYLEQYSDSERNNSDDEEDRQQLLQLTQSTSAMLETVLVWIHEQEKNILKRNEVINIHDIVLNAVVMELPYAKKRKVTVNCDISDELRVKADSVIILLLVRTLINNAIKFSDKNSSVTVTAEYCKNACVISVADKGVGIKEEEKEKIFTERLTSLYVDDEQKGLGIGLALAKQFAERQGIRLGFESKYGSGSIFYFLINRDEDAA